MPGDPADSADPSNASNEPHAATRLRKGRQLAWVLGARLSDVGARHCAGDIDALWPFELLNLLQAIYEEAALQQMDSNGMVLCDHLRAAAVGARKGL